MYLRHFGLTQEPFSIAPDPRFLFMSERHREALAHLRFGLQSGGGFVVLTGEIGAGKTTVCRCILEQIPQQCNVAYLFNPKLTARELLQSVCADFGIEPTSDPTQPTSTKRHVDALNAFLLKAHAAGQHNVLIIDEAQRLSLALLEQLRLLTNLETNERKLLQIVLIGQPELRPMLARPELEQLTQRVVARFHLGTLSAAETEQYVRHRLAVAGLAGAIPFEAAALRRIHALSRGVPRRINLLCDRALLGGYAEGRTHIDRATVEQAGREVFGDERAAATIGPVQARWLLIGAGAATALAASALLAWSALRERPAALPTTAAAPAAAAASSTPSAAASTRAPALSGSASVNAVALGSNPNPAPSADAVTSVVAGGAVAAATAAPATPAPITLSPAQFGEQLMRAAAVEGAAWQQLGEAWGQARQEGDACASLRAQGLQCFKRRGSLALLRTLDRPAILPLYTDASEARYVILEGLSATSASVRIGGQAVQVPLAELAARWREEFGVLWRLPPKARISAAGGAVAVDPTWLGRQLARARQPGAPDATPAAAADAATLKAQVQAFQRASGLTADGQVGAVTLMLLARIGDQDDSSVPAEPRLRD